MDPTAAPKLDPIECERLVRFNPKRFFLTSYPHKPPDPVVNQGGFGPLSFKLRVSWLPNSWCRLFNHCALLIHAFIHIYPCSVKHLESEN